MNCERTQIALLDLQDGTLAEAEAVEIRAHLKNCPDCQREFADLKDTMLRLDRLPAETPSPRLRVNFYEMLETHAASRETRDPFGQRRNGLAGWLAALFPSRGALQFASALALLALGIFLGTKMEFRMRDETTPSALAQLAATQQEVADLKARLETSHNLASYASQNQPSAPARLQKVVSGDKPSHTDDQALAQLLNTLAFDPSTNVRLSALEALYPHAHDRAVRQGVLAVLPRESSPLVQVAMIDFLASIRETEASATLLQLARAPATDRFVRSAAQKALDQL